MRNDEPNRSENGGSHKREIVKERQEKEKKTEKENERERVGRSAYNDHVVNTHRREQSF